MTHSLTRLAEQYFIVIAGEIFGLKAYFWIILLWCGYTVYSQVVTPSLHGSRCSLKTAKLLLQ